MAGLLAVVTIATRVVAGVVVPPVVRALEPEPPPRVAVRTVGALRAPVVRREAAAPERESIAMVLRLPGTAPRAAPSGPDWIAEAVADLAHDQEDLNASFALQALANAGDVVVPPLREALLSVDPQQRRLAGYLLCARDDEPSADLRAVAVELLRYDELSNALRPRDGHDLGATAAAWLERHVEDARRELTRALYSDDGRQRFLAAYVTIRGGDRTTVARCCAILTDHLRDNRVRNDARSAADALLALGEPALPYLAHALAISDRQSRQLIELLQDDITNPARTPAERARRRERHPRATEMYDDRYAKSLHRRFVWDGAWQWNEVSPIR